MSDSKNNPVSLVFFLLVVFFLMLLVVPALADDGHGHNDDTDVALDSVVNNAIKGGSTHTFSLSGSDADINQCRYTVGAVTVQWTRNNPWCEAMDLVRMGFIDAGVQHFCKNTSVRDNYVTEPKCIDGMVQMVAAEPEPIVIEPDDDEDDDARYDAFASEMRAEFDALKDAQQPRVTRQVIQQPFLSDEKRAKLQAILDEDNADE